jgi:hypothetical protein
MLAGLPCAGFAVTDIKHEQQADSGVPLRADTG